MTGEILDLMKERWQITPRNGAKYIMLNENKKKQLTTSK